MDKKALFVLLALVLLTSMMISAFVGELGTVRADNQSSDSIADTNSWLMFHSDLSHTGVSSSAAPTNTLLWSYQTNGEVYSSPAIANGIVYVGSEDGWMYAFQASTGALLWKFETGAEIMGSPAVANGVVYFGSDDTYVYAVNATTGSQIWKIETTTLSGLIQGSPTVAEGVVYIGSGDHYLYALNAATGATNWRFHANGEVQSSPAVVNGIVYVGSSDYSMYAINASTGTQVWRYGTSSYVFSAPAVANGLVYFGSWDHNVYAVNALTGVLSWYRQTGGKVQSSPAVAHGIVYVGSEDNYLYALDGSSGDLQWKYETGDQVVSSPALAGGFVYVGSSDKNVYAINAITGTVAWSHTTPDQIWGSPAIVDGVLYIGTMSQTSGAIYAIGSISDWPTWQHDEIHSGSATGQGPTVSPNLLWHSGIDSYVVSGSPTVADGLVFQGGLYAHFYAFNASTGVQKWVFNENDNFEFRGTPAVAYGMVYEGSMNGTFFAFDENTGNVIWTQTIRTITYASATFRGSPTVVGGVVYVGADLGDGTGAVLAYNAVTGNQIWGVPTAGPIVACPAVSNGVVYVGSYTNPVFYALDAATGNILWHIPFGSGSLIYSSATVSDGVVYFGSWDDNLHAYNATTGDVVWTFTSGGDIDSTPAVVGGVVYFGSDDGKIYAVDASTGGQLWAFSTPSGWSYTTVSSPVISGSTLYLGFFASGSAPFYAINVTSGTALYHLNLGGNIYCSTPVVNGILYMVDNGQVMAYASPHPTATISPPSASSDVGINNNFVASASGGSGTYTNYEWFVNGVSKQSSSDTIFSYAGTWPGTYSITVVVTDSLGQLSGQSTPAQLTVNNPPTVSISPTSYVMDIGQTKMFTANAVNGTGALSYLWYVDDSMDLSQTSLTYTYQANSAGSHTIYCYVFDRLLSIRRGDVKHADYHSELRVGCTNIGAPVFRHSKPGRLFKLDFKRGSDRNIPLHLPMVQRTAWQHNVHAHRRRHHINLQLYNFIRYSNRHMEFHASNNRQRRSSSELHSRIRGG